MLLVISISMIMPIFALLDIRQGIKENWTRGSIRLSLDIVVSPMSFLSIFCAELFRELCKQMVLTLATISQLVSLSQSQICPSSLPESNIHHKSLFVFGETLKYTGADIGNISINNISIVLTNLIKQFNSSFCLKSLSFIIQHYTEWYTSIHFQS